MDRTYGELLHQPAEGRKRGAWGVKAEPHVLIKLKRLFPRASANRAGVVLLAHTPDVSRDLEWFLDRYPLAMAAEVRAALHRSAEFQRRTEQLVLDITAGVERPDYGWRETARPARDYQLAPADIVHATGRLLLVDDLGLGKTYSALRALRSPEALPAVVVCPTHLPAQWLRELQLTLPWLNGHVVDSGRPYVPEERRASKGVKPDVLFISYSKLRSWAPVLAGKYRTVIFDEAQELRTGAVSDKGKAAALIADQAEFKIGLTATPIYNYADELWHILNILAPDVLGTLEEFRREWGAATMAKRTRVANPEALGSYLRDQGVFLRRTRAEVGRELPPLINIEQDVETDQKVLDQLSGDAIDLARLVLSADPKQRFVATGELDWRMRHATGVAKAAYVAAFVRMLLESEERVVLFGWHRDCFAPGTRVLMFDGTAKNVEDVCVGDAVMGPDSEPRNVGSLVSGTGKLYRVTPNRGEPWVCSENHILTVWNGRRYEKVTAKEYAEAAPRWQRDRLLYRADAVEFGHTAPVVLEPWLVGYWLGDGAASLRDLRVSSADPEVETEIGAIAARHGLTVSAWASPGASGTSATRQLAFSSGRSGPKNRNTLARYFRLLGLHQNKRIPRAYLTSAAEDRRELLAGLIDSDGHVSTGNGVGTATYTTTCPDLAADVAFIARSLGLAAYVKTKAGSRTGYAPGRPHLNVSISGDLTQLPMRVARKRGLPRAGQKDVLRTGFTIAPAGEGAYYGFEVDSDHRFLLADFTVVHNCYDIWREKLHGFRPVLYTGSETPKEKLASLKMFESGLSRVLMISLRSGAGLDGLQGLAKVAVFGELDWSPGVHAQCAGRLHRDGQVDPVVAYYLTSGLGADPAMLEVLGVKLQQSEPVINPGAPLATPVDRASNASMVRQMALDILARRGEDPPVPVDVEGVG